MEMTDKQRAEGIVRRCDSLKSKRGTWDQNAQETAEWVIPRKSYVTTKRQKGLKTIQFNTQLFDATAVFANQYMAAGLISHLAPGNSRWIGLKMRNPDLNEKDNVKASLSKLARLLHEELAASNFYMQLNELCLDLGWAGMGCMEPMEGKKTTLNFKNYHVSEFWIVQDSDGNVDTVYYRYKYTARQALQEWPDADLGDTIKAALTSEKHEDMDKEFEFIQELRPRDEYKKYPAAGKDRFVASTIVAVKDKIIVEEEGFYDMPKLTPRWLKNTNEVNGRSQGMFALPWIKLLNTTWKDYTIATQMSLRPPTLSPDDGFVGPIRAVPGAQWHYRNTYAANVNAIRQFPVKPDTKNAIVFIKHIENLIKKAFYNDLFVMLQEKEGISTAYEISRLIEEKHTMIVPPIGRLQSELFNGLVNRSIGILGRAGKLRGILAPEMIGQEYEIEYISKLALALRILETRSIGATMDVIEPIGARNPQVFDNFDDDKTVRGVAERMAYPPEMMRSIPDRDEIRRVRQEELEAQRAAELALEAAKAVPGLGKKTEEGSPLAAMNELAAA